jgi:hypothetical protein
MNKIIDPRELRIWNALESIRWAKGYLGRDEGIPKWYFDFIDTTKVLNDLKSLMKEIEELKNDK